MQACIPLLARCCLHIGNQSKEWDSIRAELDKDTLYDLLQATFAAGKTSVATKK